MSDPPIPNRRRSRIVRLPEIAERLGVSFDTVRRMVREGRFPAPFKISTRAIGWAEADVEAWLTERRRVATALAHAAVREVIEEDASDPQQRGKAS